MAGRNRSPRTRRQNLLRILGDSFLMGGIGRGLTRDPHGGPSDQFTARAALYDQGRQLAEDDRPRGLLDAVPGWLILAVLAVVVAAAFLLR